MNKAKTVVARQEIEIDRLKSVIADLKHQLDYSKFCLRKTNNQKDLK